MKKEKLGPVHVRSKGKKVSKDALTAMAIETLAQRVDYLENTCDRLMLQLHTLLHKGQCE